MGRVGLLVLLLAAALAGCGPSDSRRFLLRLEGQPGDSYTVEFQTITTVDSEPGPQGQPGGTETLDMRLVKRFTCTKSGEDATTWKVETLDVAAKGTGNLVAEGQKLAEFEKGRTETIARNDRNVKVGESRDVPLEIRLPDQEVGVGDAWRAEMNVQGFPLLLLYTVERFEEVDGRVAAVIRGTQEGGTQLKLAKPIMLWVDTATGWPIKGYSAIEQAAVDGVKARFETTMTVRDQKVNARPSGSGA
jgi:hypothetical protein